MSVKPISPEIRAMFLYVRTGILLLPALLAYLFCFIFLMPKLGEVWEEAGIEYANAEAVMSWSGSLVYYFYPILFAVAVLVALLEFKVSGWRRYRTLWLDAIVVVIYFLAFMGVLAIATCALLAAGEVVNQ